jgi:hypothetical protein
MPSLTTSNRPVPSSFRRFGLVRSIMGIWIGKALSLKLMENLRSYGIKIAFFLSGFSRDLDGNLLALAMALMFTKRVLSGLLQYKSLCPGAPPLLRAVSWFC